MDPTISDLMINGISGVYAERAGQIERVHLAEVYTNVRLTAAIERVARVLGQDLTPQNPIFNTRLPDGIACCSRGTACIDWRADAHHS